VAARITDDIVLLDNTVRRYDWGSRTAIPDLLGHAPDDGPQAELWLGAHPGAPSRLPDGDGLDAAVRADPRGTLGAAVLARFGPRLPFLLKVLAADAPLSIQVHPGAARAVERFAAEAAAGLPPQERSYTDPHHKPEMLLALTPFEALCGLRDPQDVLRDLGGLDLPDRHLHALAHLERLLRVADVRGAVGHLLTDPGVPDVVDQVAGASRTRAATAHDGVLARLADRYPRDPGVLVALLMRHVVLRPGEALHLPAGVVHAYLGGVGVEVMASSDNVLRAGLTSKRVDVPELLAVLDAGTRPVGLVEPLVDGPHRTWRPGSAELELHLIDVDGTDVDLAPAGPRVLLALAGPVHVRPRGGEPLRLERGRSAFASDRCGPLLIGGTGTVVVARVP
jgi:mannose-6-phosphate isomerase